MTLFKCEKAGIIKPSDIHISYHTVTKLWDEWRYSSEHRKNQRFGQFFLSNLDVCKLLGHGMPEIYYDKNHHKAYNKVLECFNIVYGD